MREEAADALDDVEIGRAEAGTAGFTGGEGDGTVLEAHDAAVGNSHVADIWGEIWQDGGGVWMRLAVDVPGDGPDLWGDVLQQSGCAHQPFWHQRECHDPTAVLFFVEIAREPGATGAGFIDTIEAFRFRLELAGKLIDIHVPGADGPVGD